jgi:hypothetical protein
MYVVPELSVRLMGEVMMCYDAEQDMSEAAASVATAEIVPFPAARRIGLIRNVAWMMACYRPDAAERTLAARLDATRSAMLRRGLSADVAEREIRALEGAIRARLWAIIMQGGDAA